MCVIIPKWLWAICPEVGWARLSWSRADTDILGRPVPWSIGPKCSREHPLINLLKCRTCKMKMYNTHIHTHTSHIALYPMFFLCVCIKIVWKDGRAWGYNSHTTLHVVWILPTNIFWMWEWRTDFRGLWKDSGPLPSRVFLQEDSEKLVPVFMKSVCRAL